MNVVASVSAVLRTHLSEDRAVAAILDGNLADFHREKPGWRPDCKHEGRA